MVMNYIAKDPTTLTYCLVQAFYSIQEEVHVYDDLGVVIIVNTRGGIDISLERIDPPLR